VPAVCDPGQAVQVLSATIQNSGTGDLQNYALAVPFDKNTFNFAMASADGHDLAVWDAATKSTLPFWVEAYDPHSGKALLWVKVPILKAGISQLIWITAGSIPHCSAQTSNGYKVFPFFSDVTDTANWTPDGHIAISNSLTTGPFTIQNRKVIESDGNYNSSPGLAQASNGDWVLAYRKGIAHTISPSVVLRRSQDQGQTWSDEVSYFSTPGTDPSLVRTPGGDLLLELIKKDSTGKSGSAYTRSTDYGITWAPFTFLDQPVNNTSALPTLFVNDGANIYAAGYGPSTFDALESPFLWSSQDDGLTWQKVAEMRHPGEPGTNETAIAKVGATTLLSIMRTEDSHTTYGNYSMDMGNTWGPFISYTSQVGVIQLPQLIQVGSALILLGREIDGLPNGPGLPPGGAHQLAAFVSYNGGQNFDYGTVLDDYTGSQIDGGYCWPLVMEDGRLFVVYYADSQNLSKPDIKSLILKIDAPGTVPSSSIHVKGHGEPGHATQTLNISSTRYALDFRFRSHEIPMGSEFSVSLQNVDSGQATTLVNWDLPSVLAPSPGIFSGFTANGNFVALLNSFAYDQPYRIRTVVDEAQGTQQGTVMDQFGAVLNTTDQQPLAQTLSSHANTVVIGNNGDLRATDTLLDFIFVHEVAAVEPSVSVTRVH